MIAATPTSAACTSTDACLQVPVTITAVPTPPGFTGVRGVHVILHLTGTLRLCTSSPLADITQGTYLQLAGGSTTGLVFATDNTGRITVDQAITAGACQVAQAGTLFTLNLATTVAGGSGTVVIDEVTVRDCPNVGIAAAPGPPAAVSFASGGGSPLVLTITPVPSVIWPPDKKLHNIHVNFSVSGACGTPVVTLTSITASCAPKEEGSVKKPDVVGASFGQPDFDFQLRARQCDRDHENGDDDDDECEDACEDACDAQCNTSCDRHCDQIQDARLREQCRRQERECRQKCESTCDRACDERCELDRDLIYTITYTATDNGTRSVTATATVRVHGDKKGHASLTVGPSGPPNPYGAAQTPELSLVIPSIPRSDALKASGAEQQVDRSQGENAPVPQLRFDGTDIDPTQIFLGNSTALIPVTGLGIGDADANGYDDLVAALGTDLVHAVRSLVVSADDPIMLYFRTRSGGAYEVSGLFGDGASVAVVPPPTGDPARGDDSFRGQTVTTRRLETELGTSYPNPSRGEFAVTVDLADRSEARVEVYDLRGAIVRTLMTGVHPAGRFDLVWDGRDERGRLAPNGLYLMRMRTSRYHASRSILLVR